MSLEAKSRESGGVTVVDVIGRLVFGPESRTLNQAVKQLVADGKTQVLLNLQQVTFIDSCGVGEIVAAFSTVKKSGGHLKLCSPTKMVGEVLRLVRVPTLVESFDSETDALAAFKS
jgi:anti-sigma B factor antagonist